MSKDLKVISGIQQIGIGVSDADAAWKWYRQNFGMDIPVFKDSATAELMLRYTGNAPQSRYAILAINIMGGGGFEIWQYTGRKPVPASFELQLGDLGIFAAKIKCKDVKAAHRLFKEKNLHIVGDLAKNPAGEYHFFVKDPYGNLFEIVNDHTWFKSGKGLTGGTAGCIIGVTDIEKSKKFYADILGYDEVVYDVQDTFSELKEIAGGAHECRRVLLKHSNPREGGFSKLLGPSVIELVQVFGRTPKKIYEGRYWGDLGFIHLCYDITGMNKLERECEEKGYPFTVNSSNSFDMGEAAGHFAYTEDPDGTLIEFVETHRVPIVKKLGFYLNLKNKKPEKRLPSWMISALALNRVKD